MAAKGEGKAYKWLVDHIDQPDKDTCLITWPFYRDRHGRGLLGYKGEHYWAHRLMCFLVHGEPPSPEHQAGHDCGKGHECCLNPHHIKWKTVSENAFDRWKHNPHLHEITHQNGTARMLEAAQVEEIRAAKGIHTQVELAASFNVSENVVQNIWAGKTYRPDRKVIYWAAEDIETLRDSVANGMNFAQIGRLLGKSHSSVSMKAYRMGLASGQPVRKIYDPPRSAGPGSEQTNGDRDHG